MEMTGAASLFVQTDGKPPEASKAEATMTATIHLRFFFPIESGMFMRPNGPVVTGKTHTRVHI
jgi:hypothetical protein